MAARLAVLRRLLRWPRRRRADRLAQRQEVGSHRFAPPRDRRHWNWRATRYAPLRGHRQRHGHVDPASRRRLRRRRLPRDSRAAEARRCTLRRRPQPGRRSTRSWTPGLITCARLRLRPRARARGRRRMSDVAGKQLELARHYASIGQPRRVLEALDEADVATIPDALVAPRRGALPARSLRRGCGSRAARPGARARGRRACSTSWRST